MVCMTDILAHSHAPYIVLSLPDDRDLHCSDCGWRNVLCSSFLRHLLHCLVLLDLEFPHKLLISDFISARERSSTEDIDSSPLRFRDTSIARASQHTTTRSGARKHKRDISHDPHLGLLVAYHDSSPSEDRPTGRGAAQGQLKERGREMITSQLQGKLWLYDEVRGIDLRLGGKVWSSIRLHMDILAKQLNEEEFNDEITMVVFKVFKNQFQYFITQQMSMDYGDKMANHFFTKYTLCDAQSFQNILISQMDSIEKAIVKSRLYKRAHNSRKEERHNQKSRMKAVDLRMIQGLKVQISDSPNNQSQ
ncbi:hypothetical protein Tco_0644787 [Tanacetum coccineum]